jgi:transposase-like protein
MSQRRVWRCVGCAKQFSVLTDTPFHGTKITIRKWVFVIFEMCASKNGVSAREVERKYGLCPRTAWFMMHRIREAMKADNLVSLAGTVVADETFIGGDPQRMNSATRRRSEGQPERITPGSRPNAHTAKTPVLSLVNTTTGEVRSRVVPDVTGHTLRKAIAEQVDMSRSHLRTDEGSWYRQLGTEFLSHKTVNHSAGQYVRYEDREVVTSNAAENFFSQLKRSLDGTHHHVSRVHLSRYLAEFDYRFSTRKVSDTARMAHLLSQVGGRRLTYQRTTER